MNTLNEQLNKGDIVILDKEDYIGDMFGRAFVVDGGGFGCSPRTSGRTIMGVWLDGSLERTRNVSISGNTIDAEETRAFREKYPFNLTKEQRKTAEAVLKGVLNTE